MGDIPSNHLLAVVCFQPPNGKNTCIYVQHINESKCKPDPTLLSSPGRLSESKTFFFLLRGRKTAIRLLLGCSDRGRREKKSPVKNAPPAPPLPPLLFPIGILTAFDRRRRRRSLLAPKLTQFLPPFLAAASHAPPPPSLRPGLRTKN